ncbi:glycosyltransferase [Alteromonas sediminis]|uniref:Glycosyltransferase n=1 Tax=Alteromonas sediminis TaxID=2259342 RepID=A0A3N5Y2K6_9ALTE|nr:glycosyltransferase family 4 protein [Alteromonas sediminis]RPJ67263.1 glycosyltransferase [Alteromonas sediminis]
MLNIIEQCKQKQWSVVFACAAQASTHAVDLMALGVQIKEIALNDSEFDTWVQTMNPDIVIFDRFMTEEQYAWRVTHAAPHALKVLNTEDCHSLRSIRQKHLDEDKDVSSLDIALREAAAILRSDVTLVISDYEMRWLEAHFSVPASQMILAPLCMPMPHGADKHFTSSRHISFIGNFKHAPNWDAVLKLRSLWPAIRKRIGKTEECHIYGAYPPKKATELSNTATGFLVKGWVDSVEDAFTPYRVFAAPLQFGAGIKGKLIEATHYSTPSVTTAIGCQGIAEPKDWPGTIAVDDREFIDAVAQLYNDQHTWEQARDKAKILSQSQQVNTRRFSEVFDQLEGLHQHLDEHRKAHVLSRIVNHQTLKSHQYMSQWIEAKTKLAATQ